jgi:hypothetical protein
LVCTFDSPVSNKSFAEYQKLSIDEGDFIFFFFLWSEDAFICIFPNGATWNESHPVWLSTRSCTEYGVLGAEIDDGALEESLANESAGITTGSGPGPTSRFLAVSAGSESLRDPRGRGRKCQFTFYCNFRLHTVLCFIQHFRISYITDVLCGTPDAC